MDNLIECLEVLETERRHSRQRKSRKRKIEAKIYERDIWIETKMEIDRDKQTEKERGHR